MNVLTIVGPLCTMNRSRPRGERGTSCRRAWGRRDAGRAPGLFAGRD